MRNLRTSFFALAAIAGLMLSSCNRDGCTDSTADNYDEKAKEDDGTCTYATLTDEMMAKYKTNYAAIVFANYQDAHAMAKVLQTEIEAFVANPTKDGLQYCKEAWLAAREPYGQTEAFRFSGGPIDDEDGPEGLLNAWPLDESYIDYVKGMPETGIINDLNGFPTINKEVLVGLNEQGGEENISIGYHAIEFLLWGQDNTAPSELKAGQRPYTDYLTTDGTASNQARRGEYLMVCSELLLDHLQLMVDAWDPSKSGNYYSTFMAASGKDALQNILTGIGTLSKSELAGERMFVALDNQDQEDEHSCFSDNTHRDIVLNAQGIRNVYAGSYAKTDGTIINGTSIQDILDVEYPHLGYEIDEQTKTSVAKCEEIPSPFDNQLTNESTGGNGPIMSAIYALQAQGDKIVEAANELGLSVSNELPE